MSIRGFVSGAADGGEKNVAARLAGQGANHRTLPIPLVSRRGSRAF